MRYKIVEYAGGEVHLLYDEDDNGLWELDEIFEGSLAWEEAKLVVLKDPRTHNMTVMREEIIDV